MFKKKPIIWEHQSIFDRATKRLAELEEQAKRKEDTRADLEAMLATNRSRMSAAKTALAVSKAAEYDKNDKDATRKHDSDILKAETEVMQVGDSIVMVKEQLDLISSSQHDLDLQRAFVEKLMEKKLEWEHEQFGHKVSPDQKSAGKLFVLGLAIPTIVEGSGRLLRHVNAKMGIPRLFK